MSKSIRSCGARAVFALTGLCAALLAEPQLSAQQLSTQPAALSESSESCLAPSLAENLFACDCPTWIVRPGGTVMGRSRPLDYVFIRDTATGTPLYNTRDYNFDWAGGPNLSVMRRVGQASYLEVRHFDVTGFSASQNLEMAGPFTFEAATPGPAPAGGSGTTFYSSKLFSTEANLRVASNDWLTWIAGFRWIELHERFDGAFTLPTIGIASQFNINGDNHLYGGQLGVDARLWESGRLRIEGIGKAGVYGNVSDQLSSNAAALNGVPVFNAGVSGSSTNTAFVGELGLTAAYRLTDWLSLRLGYQMLWIDGVTLAGNQFQVLDFNTGEGINNGGSVFYQGVTFGSEIRF